MRADRAIDRAMVGGQGAAHHGRDRKLAVFHDRARRAGADRDAAVTALETSSYDVKLASIMIRRGEDLSAATARLGAADGRLRTALEEN